MSASQAERRGFDSRPSLIRFMYAHIKKILYPFIGIVLLLTSGCKTTPEIIPPVVKPAGGHEKGVYHKVLPGETIWRIAKTYNVTIDDIIKSNNIPNVAQIEKGQLILIPGAERVKSIALSPMKKDTDFIWPVKGKILSYFGDHKGSISKKGIDIQSSEGDTVCASRSGTVVFADYLSGYAYTVILDHTDGYFSVYSNNLKLLVNLNDSVEQGKPVAQVGKSGDLAFLHFQIRKDAVADNPLFFLPSYETIRK